MNVAANGLDRSKYLGSSDVAGILGISPWKSPLDVYLDKIEPRVDQVDPRKAKIFSRGKRMEPYVIDMLAEETGLVVVRRNERYKDRLHPFMAAEIDAEAESGENIEIKTVSPFKSREWGEEQSDEIPLHYAAQAMHALMVTEKAKCIFGVLIGGDDFRIYNIERDEDTIASIRAKEVAFWDRVQRRDPPDATTVSDVMRLYGRDAGTAIEATDSIHEDLIALVTMNDESKRLEGEIERRENRIKVFMGASAILTVHGAPVATWKAQVSRRIDTKALETAHPDIAERFRKVIESRVFRIR